MLQLFWLHNTKPKSQDRGRADHDQKPGDHPNFRKNALGVKRPFSELAESSGVFSEQLSELEIPFSECEIPERFSFTPAFSERFFLELGWSPRTRHEVQTVN